MKKILIFCLLNGLLFSVFAQQNFFNDWYASDPNRPFVKLLVAEDAIYELQRTELLAAGHDLSLASPDSIQLFYRGEEIPLVVERDAQGAFESLTFYGQHNDGAVEAQMYRDAISGNSDPSGQPNPNLSLYSDTSAYFLTWGSASGLRYTTTVDTNYSNYTPEASYPFESIWEPRPGATGPDAAIFYFGSLDKFDINYALNSEFVPGEGYVSAGEFSQSNGLNRPFTTTFLQTPNPILTNQDVRFRFRILHASRSRHHTVVSLASNPNTVILDSMLNQSQISVNTYEQTLNMRLDVNPDLTFEANAQPEDINRLGPIHIRYQRMTDLANTPATRISELVGNFTRYFRFGNAQGNQEVWAYDPANRMRYDGLISNGQAHVILNGRSYGKSVEVVTDQGVKTPQIAPKVHLRNLCAPDSGAAFVIIAHPDLKNSAQAYAAYRDTTTAGFEPLSAKVVLLNEIYDEFSYGAPTPQAIQQFINCALANWRDSLAYIFLWGKGRLLTRGFNEPAIPTWGYPASDVRYTASLTDDWEAQTKIGRLNIYTDQEGSAYLEKVKAFEQVGDESWRKKGMFFSAASNSLSAPVIDASIPPLATCFADSMGANRTWDSVNNSFPLNVNASYHDSIDQGLSFIFITDDFENGSNAGSHVLKEAFDYNNVGRYPFVMHAGMQGGEFSNLESFGERFIKAPDGGGIAWLGSSSFLYFSPLQTYNRTFLCKHLFAEPELPLGTHMLSSYQEMLNISSTATIRTVARQMNLQGDPSLVVYPTFSTVHVDDEFVDGVQIYPNPTSDLLILSAKSEFIKAYRLMDVQGRVLLEERELKTKEVQLHLANLAAGTYLLQYEAGAGVGVKKVLRK